MSVYVCVLKALGRNTEINLLSVFYLLQCSLNLTISHLLQCDVTMSLQVESMQKK